MSAAQITSCNPAGVRSTLVFAVGFFMTVSIIACAFEGNADALVLHHQIAGHKRAGTMRLMT